MLYIPIWLWTALNYIEFVSLVVEILYNLLATLLNIISLSTVWKAIESYLLFIINQQVS